ncbi:MAG: hydrogenase [Candidatus Omnitrophota bacterium]|jgi:formate hydrogenlyase subunit 3/multisubunit Na+/H+ antiporter MnhD subunit|nr:MAG: hydrogenase [Candidatus Omnitrophota bacterium]
MHALLFLLLLLFGSGILALCLQKSAKAASFVAAGGCIVSCLIGLVTVIRILATGDFPSFHAGWMVPYGSFSMEIDALSAFFLIPIFLLAALAALYGIGYLSAAAATPVSCRQDAGGTYLRKKKLGGVWFFYNLLVASMVMVVAARNAVLFLVVWEIMSLASFFLVTFEDEKEGVIEAGWTYLVATHVGTAILFVVFLLLGRYAGSLEFDRFMASSEDYSHIAGILFLMSVIGFGTKAGFMPFHIWLPEAHPAAPSHVSAVMSGVMVKTGLYGIIRIATFLGPLPAWWGVILVVIGVSSGILGVIFAMSQHDLKRLLAYHTIENIGIISLGLGLGMLGMSIHSISLCVLGFGGGLLHILNHAIFKGLLFLNAGAILHSAGTGQIDELGGLMKRMPWTGATFLIGSIAISGIPPFNGFISEFLIYVSALEGCVSLHAHFAFVCLGGICGLALIGGLAAACFSKAFGIIFLGEPRSEHGAEAHECGIAMRIPMIVLAFSCMALGLLLPFGMGFLSPVIGVITGFSQQELHLHFAAYSGTLNVLVVTGFAIFVIVGILAFIRSRILSNRTVSSSVTWDCGYAQPMPRMQYTASSFVQPFTSLFALILRTRITYSPPQGLFPQKSSFHTETPDRFREGLFRPLFEGINRGLSKLRWLQHGRIQLYVLYIALILFILLILKLW